jgi:glycosyltransferase involved in cell wall biosynthesis
MLQAGDVYVLPSYREGFGLSVLEASCMKLPVICSDIYGMADTFVEGVTGLKCKVRDDESLLECMRKLYFDDILRLSLGEAGRDRVKRDFSKQLVTDAWVEYYKSYV